MRRFAALAAGVAAGAAAVLPACVSNTPKPTRPTAAPATSKPPASPGPSTPLDQVKIKLTRVGSFDSPVALVVRANDPALYVVEQDGMIRAIEGSGTRDVLDITDRTTASGERGLLGLAFAPDGQHLYVDYTDNDGNTNVDEYAIASDGTVDPGSRRRVLFQEQPYPNHNGGNLVFGPDGYLYIGFGDGGSGGDPQRRGLDPSTWLGKILRIDPRASAGKAYTVPPDNPFVGKSGSLPEIWSIGLRNPWRFSFDAANGDLWIGDVGQGAIEEVDFVPAAQGAGKGTSFGWSAYEGTHRFNQDQSAPGSWMPIYEYPHGPGCSVTGGFVYRGSAIPALQGAYLFSDYCAGGVNALTANGQKVAAQRRLSDSPPTVSSFGVDATGEVYIVSLAGGVFRIDPA
jgi:glucose/arabinose dehydrogenase